MPMNLETATIASSPRRRTALVSLAEFLRHPAAVGSAFPATDEMVSHVLDPIDWSKVDTFVEYGPGTGEFTRGVLGRLKADASLIAIETGEDFVELLRSTICDSRLKVVHGSAQDVEGILRRLDAGRSDCILSGLPISTLEPHDAEDIIASSRAVLHPGGQFVAYQMRRAIESYLHRHFEKVETGFEWWNIPPCHIYWASPSYEGDVETWQKEP